MSLERVRFLHSSDWQLEQPLGGVAAVPAELHDEFLRAPYRAAERVVELAIRERVDFVVLTGNLLCLDAASPHALEFLLQQFERLAEQQIAVYWLGGAEDDPDLWPAQLELPASVHTFPVGRVEQVTHVRDGETIAVLVGQSYRRDAAFRAADYVGSGKTPRVALLHGALQAKSLEAKSLEAKSLEAKSLEAKSLEASGISYWALGGRSGYQSLLEGRTAACYAGSPQGRLPQQTHRHGPLLVELKYGETEVRRLSSDLWTWRHERITLPAGVDVSGAEHALRERLGQLTKDESTDGLLLTWSVVADAPLARQLRDGSQRLRLLQSLQRQAATDGKWTLELDLEPAAIPAPLWEEDSVCGDFLRAVRELQQQPESWRKLETYLPAEPVRDVLLEQLRQMSAEQQQQLWQHVAAWGTDLLRGDVTLATAAST